MTWLWFWASGAVLFGALLWLVRLKNSDAVDNLILVLAAIVWPITVVWAIGINVRGFYRAFR